MFFSNKRNVQRSNHSADPTAGTMNVDSEVRSAVALEFSRMDELHARLREEALAPVASAAPQSEEE